MNHYFSEQQFSDIKKREIPAKIRGNKFTFVSGSGVFSCSFIDRGSALLANKAYIEDGWSILDIGCGYGVIGLSIAKAFPTTSVTLSDVNQRAIGLAKESARANKILNVTIIQSNLYEQISGIFNTVLCNPPQTAGKAVCKAMISGSYELLNMGGLLQIVVRHSKGGKDLSMFMEEVFGNMKVIAKQAGYRIYVSEKL